MFDVWKHAGHAKELLRCRVSFPCLDAFNGATMKDRPWSMRHSVGAWCSGAPRFSGLRSHPGETRRARVLHTRPCRAV